LCKSCHDLYKKPSPGETRDPRTGNQHMTRLTANDFHPEVLKLFDRYVHGLTDRRAFSKARRNSPPAASARVRCSRR